MTERELYYAERRLWRLARRAEQCRGTVMNLAWLSAFGDWQELHEQICGKDDGSCDHSWTSEDFK